MNIRRYEEKDRSQILKLFNEFGDFFVDLDKLNFIIRAINYAETFLDELIENTKKNGVIYIMKDEDVIVGFIGGDIKNLTDKNTVENVHMRKGRILELFVTEDYRSRGVGRLLMKELEEFFNLNGCHTINVEVFSQNHKAHKFYETFGYSDRNIDMMKVLKTPLRDLILVENDYEESKKRFKEESKKLNLLLNRLQITIEHIGSTAIPETIGKGIIDILVICNNKEEQNKISLILTDSAYKQGELDKTPDGRLFFSNTKTQTNPGDSHIHLVIKDDERNLVSLQFRDYLLNHPEEVKEYNREKRLIAEETNYNREEYIKRKARFIENIMNKIRK